MTITEKWHGCHFKTGEIREKVGSNCKKTLLWGEEAKAFKCGFKGELK